VRYRDRRFLIPEKGLEVSSNNQGKGEELMEVSAVNCGEVAVVDEISSGRAGTGYEYLGAAAAGAVCNAKIRGWGASGPGVFFTREPRRRTRPAARQTSAPGTTEDPALWYGDPAFPLTGGLEPISVRLDKKIDRQGRRLLWIEERGRP